MFYSHEILTSHEHGVATIWLVATLGSRSITRRLNKKAILDVDVPKACGVIMDPEAPMALRLQGSLLYGVSRVYSQQCGYTLTDVQAMHDRMRSMLRAVPGGGLDPTAGKARPDQLILPYDPSFLPENNLPGLDLDLSRLNVPIEMGSSQKSNFLWPKTPDLSQLALSRNASLQLDFSSQDIIMRDVGDLGSETDITGSVQRGGRLGRIAPGDFNDEEGILLHPDFEFDENGNLIELGGINAPTELRDQKAGHRISETPITDKEKEGGINELSWDYEPVLADEAIEVNARHEQHTSVTQAGSSRPEDSSAFDPIGGVENIPNDGEATMRQTRRVPKVIISDNQTTLRNTDLAHLNNDYVQNMAAALKQKRHNKIPTQAKKNAAFWVFGQGIGSVGIGVGVSRAQHPLHSFSGEELYDSLTSQKMPKERKRRHPSDEESDSGPNMRRVRARETYDEQVGRGGRLDNDGIIHEDVEIGRHASSVLRDDNSLQMPWNITASVHSSRHGLSATNAFRGFGNISDFSSRGIPESAGSLVGFGRPRSRLMSASPLARRSFPFDIEAADALVIPGNEGDDIDVLGDFDLSHYLQIELDANYQVSLGDNRGTGQTATNRKQSALQNRLSKTTLDQESLNFLEFVNTQMEAPAKDDTEQDLEFENGPGILPLHSFGIDEIMFTTLLPLQKTSRIVATQGLMHILTLATKGFLVVHQEPYKDLSDEEYGIRYEYGEISLRLSDF